METDFVFVAECNGDATLRVGRGRLAEIGFGEDENASGLTEFNGGANACYAGAHDEIINVIGFLGKSHECFLRRRRMVTRTLIGIGGGKKREGI